VRVNEASKEEFTAVGEKRVNSDASVLEGGKEWTKRVILTSPGKRKGSSNAVTIGWSLNESVRGQIQHGGNRRKSSRRALQYIFELRASN